MRFGSDKLLEVLRGSFTKRWLADLYYAGDRIISDLPISEPSFSDDGTALVQGTGTCTVIYQDDFAKSLAPDKASSMLAPFGAELAVYVIISDGDLLEERIEMGWYRIVEDPTIVDYTTKFLGRTISLGSHIDLTLQDRMEGIQADQFDAPGSPPSLTSTFAELNRVWGLQLTKEVADAAIARTIAYESDRLQYGYDLVGGLDAIPYMRSDGTVGQRPNVWPAAVDTLKQGSRGTIISGSRSMSNEQVYNRVVIRSSSTSNVQILATAQITTGPLRAPTPSEKVTPFGRRTYFYSSELITTAAQAAAYAPTLLAQMSDTRAVSLDVVEKFNPLREVGDVVYAVRDTGTVLGRVLKIARGTGATQTLNLELQ